MARTKKPVTRTTRANTTYAASVAGVPDEDVGRAPGYRHPPGPGGVGADSSSDDSTDDGAAGTPDLVEVAPVAVVTLDPTPSPEPKGKGPAGAATKPDVIGGVAVPNRLEAIAEHNAASIEAMFTMVAALQAAVYGEKAGGRLGPWVNTGRKHQVANQLPPGPGVKPHPGLQPVAAEPDEPTESPGSPATGGSEYGEATTTRVPAPWASVEWPAADGTGIPHMGSPWGFDAFFSRPAHPKLPAGSGRWVLGQPYPLAASARIDEQLQLSGLADVLPGGTGRTPVTFPSHWAKCANASSHALWKSCDVDDQFTQQLRIEAAPRADGKPRKAWQRDLWEYKQTYRSAAHLQLLVLQLHFMRAQLHNSLLDSSNPDFQPIEPTMYRLAFDHTIEMALAIYEASVRIVSNIRVRARDGVDAALLLAEVDVEGQDYDLDPCTRQQMAKHRTQRAEAFYKAAAKQRQGRPQHGARAPKSKASSPPAGGRPAKQAASRSSPKGGDRQ